MYYRVYNIWIYTMLTPALPCAAPSGSWRILIFSLVVSNMQQSINVPVIARQCKKRITVLQVLYGTCALRYITDSAYTRDIQVHVSTNVPAAKISEIHESRLCAEYT
jgi:hypothetical protein